MLWKQRRRPCPRSLERAQLSLERRYCYSHFCQHIVASCPVKNERHASSPHVVEVLLFHGTIGSRDLLFIYAISKSSGIQRLHFADVL
jgi:hypothetical protein